MRTQHFSFCCSILSFRFVRTLFLLLAVTVAGPQALWAIDWSTLFTAQDVRDHLSNEKGRAEALEFCRKMGISKVYVETFRDAYQADEQALKTARDFFRQAGLKVSGCVTTTRFGKPTTGWEVGSCYTHRANQEHLASIFSFTARLFDEIMIDDFLFTDCQCSECAVAKGAMSWRQYREKLMLEVSRDRILGPARAANPQVKVILKFPQWYDLFQERGYIVDKETALYDRIWVGTELRDPSSDEWGHKQQYEGFVIYRWLSEIGGAKTGGGWFDPYGTDTTYYLDQAYVSALAGAPEIMLFHYGALISDEFRAQAEAFATRRPELESLSRLAEGWSGIPAYKPPSSDPGDETYLFDPIGMLAVPLVPTAKFPDGTRAGLFTIHSLEDTEFVPKLESFLKAGGTAFVSEGLAHRLTGDPRLPTRESLELPKGKYFQVLEVGGGKVAVFSTALPRLAHVDTQNRVAQLTPALREALEAFRKSVADFAPTSLDAPPRVAVFPLRGRVAVANFTELPVGCHLTGVGGMVSRFKQVFATAGAQLAPDRVTLRLAPHSVLVVE
ncbi:MAG: hypothetical protein ABSG54_08855 [Terriglobia bacterium]|jgi:hypothetical protein